MTAILDAAFPDLATRRDEVAPRLASHQEPRHVDQAREHEGLTDHVDKMLRAAAFLPDPGVDVE